MLHRVIAPVARVWALAGGVVMLAIVLVTTVNVSGFILDRALRPFGGAVSGLPGYEDFVSLAVSVAALSFLPYCQLERGHVAVDVFTSRAPAALNRALDALWLVATIIAALFLAYWIHAGLWEKLADGAISRVLGWPQWPFFAPGVVSLALWALVAFAQLVEPNGEARRDG